MPATCLEAGSKGTRKELSRSTIERIIRLLRKSKRYQLLLLWNLVNLPLERQLVRCAVQAGIDCCGSEDELTFYRSTILFAACLRVVLAAIDPNFVQYAIEIMIRLLG